MVKLTANGGVANLESILIIDEAISEQLKKDKKKLDASTKDFGLCHVIASDEEGNIVSKLGKSLQGEFDPIEESAKIRIAHNHILEIARINLKQDKNSNKISFEDDAELEREQEDLKEIEERDPEGADNDDEEPLLAFLVIPTFL